MNSALGAACACPAELLPKAQGRRSLAEAPALPEVVGGACRPPRHWMVTDSLLVTDTAKVVGSTPMLWKCTTAFTSEGFSGIGSGTV
jgi:hypothetical protein